MKSPGEDRYTGTLNDESLEAVAGGRTDEMAREYRAIESLFNRHLVDHKTTEWLLFVVRTGISSDEIFKVIDRNDPSENTIEKIQERLRR